MSLEEKKTIQEAFAEYNTKRLKLITNPLHTVEEKLSLMDKYRDEYLKWYNSYRKQLEKEREAKKKEREEIKKDGIFEELR